MGAGEDAGQEGDARHGRGAAQALRRAQGGAGPRLQRRLALAAGVRGRLRVRADARSDDGDRRHQARHGVADADGPAAVRRRRLRQDRSRDARRVQGGDGRQAGRVPRADDRAGVSAPEDAARALRRLSRSRIDMVSRFRTQGGAEGSARPISPPARSTSSSARIGCCRRTSSSATSGCWSSTKSSASASRTRSSIKQLRKKVDVLTMTRDADSAHAEHVARRHPRHVDHRDAAEGSPVDSDQRRQVRPAGDRRARSATSWSAAGRSTSSTTASSRSSRSAT